MTKNKTYPNTTSRPPDGTTRQPVSLGAYIRERRQTLGLTQEDLAERVARGVRQSEISRLEHDRVALPRRDRLEQLAAALDVSLGELLVRTGWMNDGDRLDIELKKVPDPLAETEHMAVIAESDLVELIDQVAAVKEMVDQAAAVLDRAETTISVLIHSLNARRRAGGAIRVSAGLMDTWETSAIFI